MNNDQVMNDGIIGFESDWYIKSRNSWVKVWESLDPDVAISKVPIPDADWVAPMKNASFTLKDIEEPKILLTLGLNPRSYFSDDQVEDDQVENLRKIYQQIVQDHRQYKHDNKTDTPNRTHTGGGLDNVRKLSINKFDYLHVQDWESFPASINELVQIDMFSFRTYDANEAYKVLTAYLQDEENAKQVDAAFKKAAEQIENYANQAQYVFIAWGQVTGEFLSNHREYAKKLYKALQKAVEAHKVFTTAIKQGKNKAVEYYYPHTVQRFTKEKYEVVTLDGLNKLLNL